MPGLYLFFKRLIFCYLIFTISNFTTQSQAKNPKPPVENLLTTTCENLQSKNKPKRTQTIAYLEKENLRTHVAQSYTEEISRIGLDYFKKLFGNIVKREVELNDQYHFFYHGQKREFILLQDIYNGLYEITCQKMLSDFVALRFPEEQSLYQKTKQFFSLLRSQLTNPYSRQTVWTRIKVLFSQSSYRDITAFINHCIKTGTIYDPYFDDDPQIQKHLLSVNPSLFGNSHNFGECTFYYFLNSDNASYINILNLAQNIFTFFKCQHFFKKYSAEITHLKSLLAKYESKKTGALLQILVPTKLVDTVAYRCKPWGLLYHNDTKPENHPASKDLNTYKTTNHELGHKDESDYSFDEIQFRLLMNKTMLDPQSGIKMFRYCYETEAMKKYQTKLTELLDTISTELASSPSTTSSLQNIFCFLKQGAFNFLSHTG